MNIKEHIEAGHYPKDAKGRALVLIGDANEPGWNCGRATVLATDGCTDEEIIARFPSARAVHWRATDGVKSYPLLRASERCYTLLPPPPRKVEVKGSLRCRGGDWVVWNLSEIPCSARGDIEIEFTGSYEEPWS